MRGESGGSGKISGIKIQERGERTWTNGCREKGGKENERGSGGTWQERGKQGACEIEHVSRVKDGQRETAR